MRALFHSRILPVTKITIDQITLFEIGSGIGTLSNFLEFGNGSTIPFLNSFVLIPKQWIEGTAAIGIVSKQGRYGGTFAHKDIAFEFTSWVSVEFKLYLIKEFQRLKEVEQQQLGWDIKRNLAKINYRIHTDAIQETLIPPEIMRAQASQIYASEAYLHALRVKESTEELTLRCGLIVEKERIKEGGECNLSGERYREVDNEITKVMREVDKNEQVVAQGQLCQRCWHNFTRVGLVELLQFLLRSLQEQ